MSFQPLGLTARRLGRFISGHGEFASSAAPCRPGPLDNCSREYADGGHVQERGAAELIEEFSEELAGMSGRCIDIGCGPGTVTRKLILPRLPDAARLVGADISKKMIEFARESQSDEERLSFMEFDVEADKISPSLIGAFDNVISFYCLHWCQNLRKAFGNINQILRPGGKALVMFLAHNSGFDSYVRLSEIPLYEPYMKDVAKYIPYFQHHPNPRAELKQIMVESGFKVLHCSFREKTFVHNNLEMLNKHVQAVDPYLQKIPEDMREQFKRELLHETLRGMYLFYDDNNELEEKKLLHQYYTLTTYIQKPNYNSNSDVIIK